MLTRHGRSGSTSIFLSTLLIEMQSVCVLTWRSLWYFLKYHIILFLNCHKHHNKPKVLTDSVVIADLDKMLFCTLVSLLGLDIDISLAFLEVQNENVKKFFKIFPRNLESIRSNHCLPN